MRKIEEKMVMAVKSRTSWSEGNTTVMFNGDNGIVTLYGNHIASIDVNGKVTVNEEMLTRYPTVTTRSRLNALGCGVTLAKGKLYIEGRKIN